MSGYRHLSGRDVDKSLFEHYGIKPREDEAPENPLAKQVCRWCEFENSASARFCGRCARPLDEATAVQFESAREDADELAAKVIQELTKIVPEEIERILLKLGATKRGSVGRMT